MPLNYALVSGTVPSLALPSLSFSLEYCFRLEWKVGFRKRLASRLGSYLLVLKLPAKVQPSTVVEIRM